MGNSWTVDIGNVTCQVHLPLASVQQVSNIQIISTNTSAIAMADGHIAVQRRIATAFKGTTYKLAFQMPEYIPCGETPIGMTFAWIGAFVGTAIVLVVLVIVAIACCNKRSAAYKQGYRDDSSYFGAYGATTVVAVGTTGYYVCLLAVDTYCFHRTLAMIGTRHQTIMIILPTIIMIMVAVEMITAEVAMTHLLVMTVAVVILGNIPHKYVYLF